MVIISVSCANIKPVSNVEGSYCWYYDDISDRESIPFMILNINTDSTYEIFSTSELYNNGLYTLGVDSAKGMIIPKKYKLKLEPFYPKSYDIEILKEREDDSTFIYCYYSSYEKIDTLTTFRILNKNNEIIKDNFETDSGVIKLLPESKDWYLQVFYSANGSLVDYLQKKILRIKKGKEYRLWLQNLETTRTEEQRFEFVKLSDTSYFLINKALNCRNKYGDLKTPIEKCDFDTAMNQIKNWHVGTFRGLD